jgi:hypothetical protein
MLIYVNLSFIFIIGEIAPLEMDGQVHDQLLDISVLYVVCFQQKLTGNRFQCGSDLC